MKALVYTAPGQVELLELPRPDPKAGEVLIRVRATGICGSDRNGFLGRSKKRVPPLVLGHEFSGEIVEAGAGVHRFSVGTPVAVFPLVTCGHCEYCRTNRHHICRQRKLFGLDFHGALAEYVAVPEDCAFPLSPQVSYVGGALVEPLAVALHALEGICRLESSTCLIYGGGTIGMMIHAAARFEGVSRVAMVERNPYRIDILRQLSVDLVIDSSKEDPVARIKEWTGGKGVHFAIDAVGKHISRQHVMQCTAPGGVITLLGLVDDRSVFDVERMIAQELHVRGTYAYSRETFARALTLIESKALTVESLVTRATLEEGPQVFDKLLNEEPSWIKLIFSI